MGESHGSPAEFGGREGGREITVLGLKEADVHKDVRRFGTRSVGDGRGGSLF